MSNHDSESSSESGSNSSLSSDGDSSWMDDLDEDDRAELRKDRFERRAKREAKRERVKVKEEEEEEEEDDESNDEQDKLVEEDGLDAYKERSDDWDEEDFFGTSSGSEDGWKEPRLVREKGRWRTRMVVKGTTSSDHFQLPLSRFSSVSSSSYAITSHANAKTANDPGPLALDQDFSADNQGDLDQDSNSDGNSIASSIAYSLEYLSDGEAPHQLNSDNDNNLNNINNSQLVHLPPTPNASSIINSDNHDPSSTTGLPPSGLLMPSNTSSSNNSSDNVGGLPITDGRVVGGVNVDGAGGGDDGRDQADNEDGIEEMNIGDEGGDGEGEGGAGEAEVIENKPENTIRPGAGAGEHASLADGTGGTGGRDRNDMDEDDEDEDDLFAFESEPDDQRHSPPTAAFPAPAQPINVNPDSENLPPLLTLNEPPMPNDSPRADPNPNIVALAGVIQAGAGVSTPQSRLLPDGIGKRKRGDVDHKDARSQDDDEIPKVKRKDFGLRPSGVAGFSLNVRIRDTDLIRCTLCDFNGQPCISSVDGFTCTACIQAGRETGVLQNCDMMERCLGVGMDGGVPVAELEVGEGGADDEEEEEEENDEDDSDDDDDDNDDDDDDDDDEEDSNESNENQKDEDDKDETMEE